MGEYIMTIDAGTASVRAVIYNRKGECVSIAAQEFEQHYPQNGWIEHDANDIWAAACAVIKRSLQQKGLNDSEIKAIGVTNQRETVVVWDKNDGKPIYHAIVWGDRRTADYCEELRRAGHENMIKQKTGLVLDAYFSGTKIKWILDNVDGARSRAEKGDLLFSNIDGWIIWNLTKGSAHVTDYSNASRTLIYNISELKWDKDLLKLFTIPESMLPQVLPSSGHFANTSSTVFSTPIPIEGCIGDQQSATFGQCCFQEGFSKFTYGTAGTMTVNTGGAPIVSKNGMLTTIGWGYGGKVQYLLEGTVYNAGSTIQWLRDEMKFVEESRDSEYFALKAKTVGQVYLIPAFSGFGAPYWDSYARAAILGLSRGSEKNDVIRAALDSLAYQTRDMLDAMNEDLPKPIHLLRVDGGACKNTLMVQFIADVTGIDVERPSDVETTAAGAAYLAGLSIGFWKDLDEITGLRKVDKVFVPEISADRRAELYGGWKRAVNSILSWSKNK
ncbi:MAG: glycerol kinase GlpK [Treponema sp.]|jgi:glycerol kinase|nr:glycerol kinase GlpK [Treponema sp.]